MARKIIILSIIYMVAFGSLSAQTYTALWRQVESAQKSDLPQDALTALRQIEEKATKDKEYGHLLKAQLQTIATAAAISCDSLAPCVHAYVACADNASPAALKAVYNTTLGYIYEHCAASLELSGAQAQQLAQSYYRLALASPALLAKQKARTYEPLAIIGTNATIFNNDLLHLLAFTARDYQTMIDYYTSVGNRPAACMASLYKLREERAVYEEQKKSKYLAQVDSLIHVYYDLDVAGELAIEHFNVLDASPDASAEEKIAFIDDALVRWQNWPRMVVLRNARSRITLPAYNIDIPATLTIPGKEIPVYITSLKNLQSIQMSVYSLDITGDEEYDLSKSDDYKALAAHRSDKPVATDSRTYYGLPEYREIRDTLTIAPLPVGIYLVEFSTDASGVAHEHILLHITNLRVVDMNLPGDQMRLIAVDATTGKPIPHASIHIKFREWRDRRWQEDYTTLTTESDGEVIYSSTISPYKYRVTTGDDKAFPWQSLSRRTWSAPAREGKATHAVRVYTDRAIYRPGQMVQVAALAYTSFSQEQWEVLPQLPLHVLLRNAQNDVVGEQDITTDAWGVAAAAFTLPADAPTGYYSLQVRGDDIAGYASCRVEEYKRPTFTIDIDDYQGQYAAGDTIIVKAWAKTYSGVPIAGAMVKYSVTTALNLWWCPGSNATSETLVTDETTTATDGSFLMMVPVAFPADTKKGCRVARITLAAQVTSGAGETHSANAVYPLSDRPTILEMSGFDDKQCREDIKPFSFVYMNNAGQALADTVSYTIDNGAPTIVATNSEVRLPATLPSGEHRLRATCQSDTIERPFIVFSLHDTIAPVDTAAWYYSTTGQEKNYTLRAGQAEYIQFGTSRADQTIFYAVTSDTELLESGQIVLTNELVKREIIYKEEWGNGIALRYTWVRDGKLYSYSESLARPVKDCSLEMSFATFRDHLTPGAQEEWTITVRTADGSAAPAQVMAALYDKALDAIYKHDWSLAHKPYYSAPTIYQTAAYDDTEQMVYGEQTIRYLSEPTLAFATLALPDFDICDMVAYGAFPTRVMMKASVKDSYDAASNMSLPVMAEENGAQPYNSDVAIRENLSETAFFLPQLTTDKTGTVEIKFTLPESLTTWRFLSIAHDKAMNVGSLQAEAIAQKKLMIEPNIPRFLREGDTGQIKATIYNNATKVLTATAAITISDAATGRVVFKDSQPCTLAAEGSTVVAFTVPALPAEVYTCVVSAQTATLSDGEQHYLPVLSEAVEVVTTRAFTQTTAGEMVVPLASLYGAHATAPALQVEYTDNPAWLLLAALPAVATPDVEDAISLAVALYANSLTTALYSHLPMGATRPPLPVTAEELTQKLRRLQNADGSFAWFAGMLPSTYATHAVVRQLVRLQHAGIAVDKTMLASATAFLDKKMAAYVADLRKSETTSGSKSLPNDMAMDYLYLQTLAEEPLNDVARDNADYLLSCVRDCSSELTIYGKANFAVIFAQHPLASDMPLARTFLASVEQYSVYDAEMGRYFDTPKALPSWRSYKIPTQTAAIEAFQTVAPAATQTIGELQQWLLQAKRTQQWDTPINSADAIYAFFNGWQGFDDSALAAAAVPTAAATELLVDGVPVRRAEPIEGKGYFSTTMAGQYNELVARKTSENISWGAVSVACTQPLDDVAAAGEGLSITRTLLAAEGTPLTADPTIGQKIRVRLTVTAQRDLDFVEVADHRPACFEPENPLSGYRYGCYVCVRDDKTLFFFDHLAKGRHVIETDYYVDRVGDYRAALATARCCYAPEYYAREGAQGVHVDDDSTARHEQ